MKNKKINLRALIKEEIAFVLREQEASEAMESIEAIKKHVKDLMDTDIAKEDPVLQRLLAKYTGLLGKITGYIKKKGVPAEEPKEEPVETPKTDLRKIAPVAKETGEE